MSQQQTYYEFFSLPNFEPDQNKIKAAYRSMALKWHPDRNTDKTLAHEKMQQVNEVYRILSTCKQSYDRHLRAKLGVRQRPTGSGPHKKKGYTKAGGWTIWEDEASEIDPQSWEDLWKAAKEKADRQANQWTKETMEEMIKRKARKQEQNDMETQRERWAFFSQLTNDEWIEVRDHINDLRKGL